MAGFPLNCLEAADLFLLEALSRGIDKAYIFEKNTNACAMIKANAEKCRFTEELLIQRTDAKNAAKLLQTKEEKAKLLFIDPPYAETKFYNFAQEFSEAGLLTENAVIVCEHDKNWITRIVWYVSQS